MTRRKPLLRKTPLRADPAKTAAWKQRTACKLPHVGKKGRANIKANKVADKELVLLGITRCELRFSGCWGEQALGRAHLRKRRNLKAGELEIIVLACNPCHDIIEAWPEERMTKHLQGVIAARVEYPTH